MGAPKGIDPAIRPRRGGKKTAVDGRVTAPRPLTAYRAKRTFEKTPEPRGEKARNRSAQLHFVVQKHAASHLHYDFRLELDGVLKSWAVPKGIPTERGEKRLAMRVEDHPLDYADFEGIIPAGNYGAGTVMVWDRGTYETLDRDPRQALERGKIELRLHGKKLKSDWTLVRMRGREEEHKEPWLLIKTGDSIPPFSPRSDDRSAISARSMKGIASAPRPKVWKQ
jgi:bifunctional non-homologous end joining protein LigD